MMSADEKVRGLRLYTFLLLLNKAGEKALKDAVERQNPHHGKAMTDALVAALSAYLQTEGE